MKNRHRILNPVHYRFAVMISFCLANIARQGKSLQATCLHQSACKNMDRMQRIGTVYFVATPIGNLGDISARAIQVIREADVLAAEDTRIAGRLLHLLDLPRPRGGIVSNYEHNVEKRTPMLVRRALSGESIAVISDAGTPGISDPGASLVLACASAGVPVVPIPGPCAAITAMSVSGFSAEPWTFFGFIPSRRGAARRKRLLEVSQEEKTCVLYEAPHRLYLTLKELIQEGDPTGKLGVAQRSILICRELTKLHEEFYRGTVCSALEHISKDKGAGRVKGEFTVVLDAMPLKLPSVKPSELATRLRYLMEEGTSTSTAARQVAVEYGVSKQEAYRAALAIDKEHGEAASPHHDINTTS